MRERLDALDARRADLTARVAGLERKIGALKCASAEVAPADPPPAAPAIDAEAWNAGDISLLEGCWMLDSSFRTTNVVTGAITNYTSWRMCFDPDGSGAEELRSDTGVGCAGPVSARFEGAGTLVIEEPGNLRCGDGGRIYRMINRCALRDDGTALCELRHPELDPNRAGSVSFRRAPGSE